uniref:BHLH domain-containing protein n=1 Tax=Leersia perrieri TaxID=77586 RepID=A0A0D9WIB0_9ORYZ
MADEWWINSAAPARTGDDEAAACSTAPVSDESSAARSSAPMSFCQSGLLPDAAAASSLPSPFLFADRHMDYWTQDFIGGRSAPAGEAAAAAADASFNTLLQLQGDAASHQLLLDAMVAPQGQGVSPYEQDSRFVGSSEIFGQPAMEEEQPQFHLQALSNTERLHQNASSSAATRSSPGSPAAAKKPRIETPSPLPTFKTDTASVLHEAIEYIKFLHDQVASLSSPYLRCGRPMQQQHQEGHKAKDNGEAKQDLRSRGLCLVPVASTYTVANETAMDFWHPTFGGTFR